MWDRSIIKSNAKLALRGALLVVPWRITCLRYFNRKLFFTGIIRKNGVSDSG